MNPVEIPETVKTIVHLDDSQQAKIKDGVGLLLGTRYIDPALNTPRNMEDAVKDVVSVLSTWLC